MRIKITGTGIFGQEEVPVGGVFTLNGHPPASWAGKYIVVDDKGKEVEGELVTGEDKGDGKAKGEAAKEAAEEKGDEKGEEKGERRPRPEAK